MKPQIKSKEDLEIKEKKHLHRVTVTWRGDWSAAMAEREVGAAFNMPGENNG